MQGAATISIVFGWESSRDEVNNEVIFWWRRDPNNLREWCRSCLIPLWPRTKHKALILFRRRSLVLALPKISMAMDPGMWYADKRMLLQAVQYPCDWLVGRPRPDWLCVLTVIRRVISYMYGMIPVYTCGNNIGIFCYPPGCAKVGEARAGKQSYLMLL